MTSTPADGARLFFALWPDAALRARLARLARAHAPAGSRPVAADNLHLTLAFLGQVPATRRAAVEEAAAAVRGAPLTLALDRLEQWPRPQVFCAVGSQVPEGLQGVVEQLRAALAARDLPSETRPFRIHVTLARKARRLLAPQPLPAPLPWHAERFCLVASESRPDGVRYRPLAWWPLAAE
ncbi:MAG TPA: RNA 2',3'-cyclic phosphodiesterase [Gammaproteobacteria bacterium]